MHSAAENGDIFAPEDHSSIAVSGIRRRKCRASDPRCFEHRVCGTIFAITLSGA